VFERLHLDVSRGSVTSSTYLRLCDTVADADADMTQSTVTSYVNRSAVTQSPMRQSGAGSFM